MLRIPAPKEGETVAIIPVVIPEGGGPFDETDRLPQNTAPILNSFADLSISGAAQRNLDIQLRALATSEALAQPRYVGAIRGYSNELAREIQKKRARVRS